LRREHIDNAYEQLKNLTRGEDFNQNNFEKFIQSLDVPKLVKPGMLALSPITILGLHQYWQKNIAPK
jgi:adenylosuccinate lyase